MAISRGELKGELLSFLNKSPGYQGFYDDKKMDVVIQECIDYLASRMMFEDSGWMAQLWYLPTVSNQTSIIIPADVAIINHVRYLVGPIYNPMTYVDDDVMSQWNEQSGAIQYPTQYRILQNKIYFNPACAVGADNALQIEGSAFPERLRNNDMFIQQRFNRGLIHYVKYRAASVLASQFGKVNKEWQGYENQWYAEMEKLLGKRVNTVAYVRDFD